MTTATGYSFHDCYVFTFCYTYNTCISYCYFFFSQTSQWN